MTPGRGGGGAATLIFALGALRGRLDELVRAAACLREVSAAAACEEPERSEEQAIVTLNVTVLAT